MTSEQLDIKFAQKSDLAIVKSMDPSFKGVSDLFLEPDTVCWLLLKGDNIVGFIAYHLEYSWYSLKWVFIKEEFRGFGYAREFMNRLISKIMAKDDLIKRGFITATIEDRDSVESMKKIRFLRNLGFVVSSVDYEKQGQIILQFHRPEFAVHLIKNRGRMEPYFDEYSHLDLP